MSRLLRQILKKRIDLPSVTEVRFIVRTLEHREKIIFGVLTIIFLASLMGLLWKVNKLATTEIAVSGGSIYEGVVGTPRFINPLIAISGADHDLTELVYAGLLKSDQRGDLSLELAKSYEISDDGLSYTFVLKKDLKWHDGEDITSEDIAFTIKMAKTPLLKSIKRANWEGVEAEIIDPQTIKFVLRKPYAPFLENTTLEIIPKHIWKDVNPEQISLSNFNTEPIGAGPYKIKKISRNSSGIIDSYILTSYKDYVLGRPYIKNLIFKFYNSETELLTAYQNSKVENIGSISPQNISSLGGDINLKTITLPRIFGVFFNQNKNKALTDEAVRKALIYATDKEKIVKEVLNGYGSVINHPIPPGVLGSIEGLGSVEEKAYDPEKAKSILLDNDWKLDEESKVMKKKTKKEEMVLEISLSTSIAPDLVKTARLLEEMWKEIGVKVNVKIFEIGDFDKNVIRDRDYDILLFGEVVGYDPDPFAFWHSSQRNDPGLNIALYANITVDKLLEDARIIVNREDRKDKYATFQEEISKDIPAIFLYSPNYLYIVPKYLKGINITHIITPSKRFMNVEEWYIDTKKVWKFLID